MNSKLKRTIIAVIFLIAFTWGLSAIAAEYPGKPVTLVIPYPAGGSTDVTTRTLGAIVQKYLGQPLIIENKGGGGSVVGTTLVVSKSADGYTLGTMASGPITISWHMGKLSFHPIDDVTLIMRLTGYLMGIAVRADSPWKTLPEFVDYAKKNPAKVSFGSPGVGTGGHLAMEELAYLAGIKILHVPYKGGAETNTALLGGHVDIISDSSGWAPLVDSGKFRLLATYTEQRSERFKVPTVKELGYNMVMPSPVDLFGPKNLPQPIVQKVHDVFKKAMEDPEYVASLKKFDMMPAYLGPMDLAKTLRKELDQVGKIVQKVGLQKK